MPCTRLMSGGHLGDRALEGGAAGALGGVRQVEHVARREPERIAPPGAAGQVAERGVALLDLVEPEREGVPGVAQLRAAPDGRAGDGARRAADPDRRMRPLGGARGEGRAPKLTYWPLYSGMSAAHAALMARM